jgi:hypothetical protein
VGTHLEPVALRQHDVEDDRVVSQLRRPPEALLAVVGDVDGEALSLETAQDGFCQSRLVLDDEHPHVT